jgi:hypothetical protein
MKRLAVILIVSLLSGEAGLVVAAGNESVSSPVTPSFQWLKFGELMPSGWIKAQMLRDIREGFAGHLDELATEASSDIFGSGRTAPGKPNLAVEGGPEGSWWNGETEGNWRAGFIMMAYLSGDPGAIRKADAYVQHILQTQDQDGYIGVYSPELRYSASPMSGELWTQACILRALLADYELTGNATVLSAVERAVGRTMSAYGPGKWQPFQVPGGGGGLDHGLMFTDVVARLYELTGNTEYRNFGLRLYRDFSAGIPNRISHDATLASLLDIDKPFSGHAATTLEHLRVPLWAYYVTGDPELKRAFENGFLKLRQYVFPSGAVIGMEAIEGRKPDPTYAFYEYCAMKELNVTLSSALQKTGKGALGDSIEKLAFNAAEGARGVGGKCVTYCTRDNRYEVSRDLDGRDKFSPVHSDVAVCCNPNAVQMMPQFVRAMWMRTPEDGLAALLYGPSVVNTEVKGVRLRVEEKTDYPFSPVISITLSPERAVDFPLVFRNPQWSKDTQVHCDGATVSLKGDYFTVRKVWNKGDQVTLNLSESVVGVEASNGEQALQRGPLVYALRIPSVAHQSKTYRLAGFADLEYSPAEGANWSYELDTTQGKGDFGFTAKPDPDANMDYPFDGAPIRLEGKLINLRTAQREDVSLIPMASSLAVLRRVTFPVVTPFDWLGQLFLFRSNGQR